MRPQPGFLLYFYFNFVQVPGIEPRSQAWKARVITTIRYLRVLHPGGMGLMFSIICGDYDERYRLISEVQAQCPLLADPIPLFLVENNGFEPINLVSQTSVLAN
jgi:hypothetical protein